MFPEDYFQARDRFVAAVDGLGWQHQSFPMQETGPNGETLSIDAAFSPTVPSGRTLVVSSGLHGVEAGFGSAVQLAWLQRFQENTEPAVRQIVIHALNPFGYVYRRRTGENNVDLNRNFLQPSERYQGSPPGYAELNGFLNPKGPPARFDFFLPKAVWLLARLGTAKLQQVIAVGQYDFPEGLFFGGTEPSWLNRLLAAKFEHWIEGSRDIVHIDLHTGLGSWGQCQLLIDYPIPVDRLDRLKSWLGPADFEAYRSGVASYRGQGSLGGWLVSRFSDRKYAFAFLEIGTYGGLPIVKGLRAENQAYRYQAGSPGLCEKHRRRLQQLFCPEQDSWRRQALEEALTRLERVYAGLAGV